MTERFGEEVEERLTWWSENHNMIVDEARTAFIEYCADTLTTTEDELRNDEAFASEAAETFVVERRMVGSSMPTAMWVGSFCGVDKKATDKAEDRRMNALQVARTDLDKAIQDGLVARAFESDGWWHLEKANGEMTKTDSPTGEDPWFLVRSGNMTLAILQNNPDWQRHNEPIRPYRWTRKFHFFGNAADEILNETKVWTITIPLDGQDDKWCPQFGEPAKVNVLPPREGGDARWAHMLNAPNNCKKTIIYADDFVEEGMKSSLRPETLWTLNDELYVDNLTDLDEIFQTKQEDVGLGNPVGPLVIVKGKMSSLNLTPYESEYDPSGIQFVTRVTSFDLQRAFSDPMSPRREVQVRVHGFLGAHGHGFEYATDEGWRRYAEKSTVLIFGRLGMRNVKDGEESVPRINALGIYAIPRLAIDAGEGGEFDLDQFRGD
tara:strand:+ start:3160 stop:4464 length:1305 start_codon:yes stop_codon:yes gene_type:complete